MRIFIIILLSVTTLILSAEEESSFKFSPYIKSINEYNSNFFRAVDNQAGIIMFKVLPGFDLKNRNNRNTDIKFGLNASYKYFLSLTEQYSDTVSNNSDFDLDTNLNLAFFKAGNFSIYTSDNFSKLSYSGYNNPIRKLTNSFNFMIKTTPFGKALAFKLGYGFNFNKTIFTDDLKEYAKVASEAQDNLEHSFSFDLEWRFLPKTAVIFSSSYGMIVHYNADGSVKTSLNIIDSTPIISKIGLKGVITPKLALKLLLGWAYVIYEAGDSYNAPVSNIELTYNFSKKTNFVLGFRNSFKDVLFSNYLAFYSLYSNTKISLTENITLNMGINADMNNYPTVALGANVTAPSSRFDIDTRFFTGISYGFKKYSFELKYSGRKIFTDFYTVYNGTKTEYNYLQHIVSLNLVYLF